MKKNVKTLVIVLAAAVVLAGIMVVLIFLPDSESSTATVDEGIDISTSVDDSGVHQAVVATDENGEIENNSYGSLLEYVPADISKIHVENTSGTFDVTSYTPVDEDGESDTTEYTLVGYEDFELQSGMADEIATDAAQLEFTKVVSLDGENSSDYGFDKPTATVTVTYTDDTTAVIIVGDNAPQNTGTYVKFGGSDTVYYVATDAVDAFSYSLTDLFSLTINDSASDSDDSQAKSIEIGGTHLSDKIVIKPNTNENISASYMITSPKEGFAGETTSSNVEGDIRGLYATAVKAVNPTESQLEEYGLSDPYATLKAVYSDTTVELIASQPDSDGNVNLMEKDGKVVYEISSESVVWTTVTYEDMVSEYIFYPEMTALTSLTVNNGSESYKFTLSSEETTTTDDDGSETTSTTTTVSCGKNEIELGYFTTYYQNLTLITRTDIETSEKKGSPVFSAKYVYSDGSSDTVEYYDSGESTYLAFVNGSATGHVRKSGINKLISQTADAAANKQVDNIN